VDILVARTEQEISHAFDRLSNADQIGCDTETSGFSARNGRLFSVQFSDGEFNVLVPASEGVPLGALAGILSNTSIIKIFHNSKFDLEFLNENGYAVDNVFDTMIAEKVLTRGARQSSSLAETLYRYFAVDLDKSQRAKFSRKWDGIWTDELVDYALSDVVHLPRLMQEQNDWMAKLGMLAEYAEQMQKLIKPGEALRQSTPDITNGDMPDALP
jgi:DNA polymerase-1